MKTRPYLTGPRLCGYMRPAASRRPPHPRRGRARPPTKHLLCAILLCSLLIAPAVGVAAPAAPAAPQACGELFFSEYVEGSYFNKALEIFNGSTAAVDLAAYRVELYSNGSATPSQGVNLSGLLAAGGVFVMAHSSAAVDILDVADLLSSTVVNFNGDDAVVLKHSGAIIDVIGQIGFDPGTEWGSGSVTDKRTHLAPQRRDLDRRRERRRRL